MAHFQICKVACSSFVNLNFHKYGWIVCKPALWVIWRVNENNRMFTVISRTVTTVSVSMLIIIDWPPVK